ncbi:hypothetical protein [Streptomyces sp. 5-10]|uniref:hypothetical protein n=1 Tax=Streptomyces sp. 5-10 TaxID=878925 RepID=UPI00168A42FA|nr:hypothetical protein [Streptomyces sp. 5-10]MBD3004862.1 hypothetical protein [Streptomyces sp. 5-10]
METHKVHVYLRQGMFRPVHHFTEEIQAADELSAAEMAFGAHKAAQPKSSVYAEVISTAHNGAPIYHRCGDRKLKEKSVC